MQKSRRLADHVHVAVGIVITDNHPGRLQQCVRHQKQLKFDHVLFMYPCKARCQPDLQNLAEKRLHFFVPCVGLCPKKKRGGKALN